MKNKAPIIRYLYRNALPQLLQDKIDVLRGESQVFRPCFQETKSIFIHIPKAAGTSIARAIYGMNVGHRKASDYIAVSKSEFYKYFRFTFVRNPWDRTVSAYNFVKQGGTDYVRPLPNPIYKTSIFNSFETFITEWLPTADLDKEDNVFSHQHPYIYNMNGELLVNFIGKTESMTADIEYINNKLNLSVQVEKLNSSHRKENDYRLSYTDHTAQIVKDIYSKDVSLFDYKF